VRVLYLLRYFPTLTETFVYREIAGLVERGVSVEIAALGTRADGALQDELPRVPVHRVPRRPLIGRLRAHTAGQRWLRDHQRSKDVARLPWLTDLVARRGIDHLHVHFGGEAAEMACALCRDGGPPYTVTVHAVDLFKPRPALPAVLREADAVLTIALAHVQRLAGMDVIARLVRCGVSLAPPPPLPGGPISALFVGRDVPKKGLDVLLTAWAERPPGSHLHLITDRSIAGAALTAHGLLPPSRVRARLAATNLAVLPCRRARDGDLDGVPVVLMEALAAGRPVVTTPVSGIPELVDDAVGWLVPPDDPVALAAALRAADDPTERARRGAVGPDRLRERGFTVGSQVDGVLAALRDVADSN